MRRDQSPGDRDPQRGQSARLFRCTSVQRRRGRVSRPAFGNRPYNAVGADAHIGPGSVRAEQRCSAGNLPAFFGSRPYNAVGDGSPVPRSVHVRACGTGRLIAGLQAGGCGLPRQSADWLAMTGRGRTRSPRCVPSGACCLLPVAYCPVRTAHCVIVFFGLINCGQHVNKMLAK